MMAPGEARHLAIDGPAGSGKSSVARALASRLTLDHVDTGAMYRALTHIALRDGLDLADAPQLATRLQECHLEFHGSELRLDGASIEAAIRSEAVTAAVSQVSAHAEVREAMVALQREICWASPRGAVMEGRDIGSVVLPLARTKIYLDASPRERARRRLTQIGGTIDEVALDRMEVELERRDHLDSSREHSPLQISPDARFLETTGLEFDAVVEACARIFEADQELATVKRKKLAPGSPHYRIMWILIRTFSRTFFRMKVVGHEAEMSEGGVLCVSNHISGGDPPLVGVALRRELHFLAKAELFRPPFGFIIRAYHAIPLRRGRWDGAAIERAEAVIKKGEALLMFPEGTRRPAGHPGPIRRGLGMLVLNCRCPYLPVFTRGSDRLGSILLGKGRLEFWIGPPVHLHAVDALRAQIGEKAFASRVGELFLAQLHALEWLADQKQP